MVKSFDNHERHTTFINVNDGKNDGKPALVTWCLQERHGRIRQINIFT